jgi:electron transport complex protein RnfG
MTVKSIFSDFKPAVILALITAAVTMLLVLMQNAIQSDEDELSGRLKELCVEFMGDGEFLVITDWGIYSRVTPEIPKSVKKTIINEDNRAVAFQIVVKGYNRDGLDMLIVMNEDGAVRDLAVVRNTETPGIGTRVEEPGFLENFIGLSEASRIIKGNPRNENEIAAITGATKSARGVSDAVNIAINTYAALFGGEYAEVY